MEEHVKKIGLIDLIEYWIRVYGLEFIYKS
jgi:hypothetical protein